MEWVAHKVTNVGAGCYSLGPPTGAILFHNLFETDLSVVTTPNRFSQNVADFHY